MSEPRDFHEDLDWSNSPEINAFWMAAYRHAFPTFVGAIVCPPDTDLQRMGIDRLVYLENNVVLRIDEKTRRKSYPDLVIETVSCDHPYAPGGACFCPLACPRWSATVPEVH
jgi:hypothetical protein